jgi:GDP-L-fucose synthase
MDKNSKIYVAGHHGLVGSAIWKILENKGYNNLVGRTHKELDLLDGVAVREFFDNEQPDYVILAAAFVGGIMANSLYRADFIYRNLQIQQNVIGESFRHHVKKLLFLGSTCIYPKNAPQPMKEDALLTSPLEYTNEPYAIAKIAGLKMCESFDMEYGTNYIAVMPTNLYGPNDNFDLVTSHVMPAMIRKMILADALHRGDWNLIRKDLNKLPVKDVNGTSAKGVITEMLKNYGIYADKLVLWGTGKPLREFLWSEEMADASVYVLEHVDYKDVNGLPAEMQGKTTVELHEEGYTIPEVRNCHINVGTGKELTIAELADTYQEDYRIRRHHLWDETKPDGTMRKLIDVSKLHQLGWHHQIEIEEGVRKLVDWYRKN